MSSAPHLPPRESGDLIPRTSRSETIPAAGQVAGEEMRRIDTDLAGDGIDLPEPSLECFNGWLSPDGRIYPCLTGNHIPLAQQLAARYQLGDEDGERLLTRAGWAKLMTRYATGALPVWLFHTLITGAIHGDFDRLTPAQQRAMREWHGVHGLLLDEFDCAPKTPWIPWLSGARAGRVDGD